MMQMAKKTAHERRAGDWRISSGAGLTNKMIRGVGYPYSGLARAWQWAGASNVVMSLWSVDDEATKELMTEFVDGLMKGQARDNALQAAMLQLRGKYPSPSHWASFAVYGAPERLEKEQP